MLAIVGASGKIGGATLDALLQQNLIPSNQIIATTSAHPGDTKWTSLASKGIQVRHATFDEPASFDSAFKDCDRLFLVSSPRKQLDFFDAPPGKGREKDHFVAIDAAERAGVKNIYYTSLAFANPSKAVVMTAHERTEDYLKDLPSAQTTIIREGLYNESWPLYFGHYDVKNDDRREVVVAGDGPISWTAIPDLGLANALVLAAPADEYAGKTLYLSHARNTITLSELARLVSKGRGYDIDLRIVTREEHEAFYINERGMNEGDIKWWASTYAALPDGECEINDDTFDRLLASKSVTPRSIQETVAGMLS